MYVVFVLFWILLNGRFTWEILLFGLGVGAAVYLFACRFLDFSIKKDLMLLRTAPRLLLYFLILIKEIAVANYSVLKLVYSVKNKPEPAVVYFKTDLQTSLARTMLANSITLTPGTITVSMVGEEFCVHCLHRDYADGIEDSVFVKQLRKMEDCWK